MFAEKKKSTAAAIILCVFVFVFTALSIVLDLIDIRNGNVPTSVSRYFSYFTIESNILCAIVSLLIAAVLLSRRDLQSDNLPLPLMILHHISTTVMMITFLTVICYLAPTQGISLMYGGTNIFLHFICPLFSMISFTVLENAKGFRFSHSILGIIPALLYGAVYFYNVLILGPDNGGWDDFYGFNAGGMWYISTVAMAAVMLIVGIGIYLLNQKLHNSPQGTKQ